MTDGGEKVVQFPKRRESGIVVPGQEQQRKIPLRTYTEVTFQGCGIEFLCILDEDNICQGYQMHVLDPVFNRKYVMRFADETRDEILSTLGEMPRMGEKAEEIDGDTT